ncbi:Crinkler (CRN) [Phytophthora megakarya]|uniref:Crinkler (CRN) n=1 Tax=Phytophthora megakarya TaxID=4795 RepID=A0A225VSL3_9STRA|nr:Crinkler (CRN) [Phytophthora megakarya]
MKSLIRYMDTFLSYSKLLGEIIAGKDANRLHFMVPLLAGVCALCPNLTDETVVGKRVHGDGTFEFVLPRGDKPCVGNEALADVYRLMKVYSIVTNFVEWSSITISTENHVPTRESVKRIAGMVYSNLSEDN